MEIVEAHYTTGEVGGIYNIELERHLDHVQFSANIIPPIEVSVTYRVVCSMAGTFHLPSASLSVLTTAWTVYSSEPYGPITVISDSEQRLSDKMTEVESAVTSTSAELGGEIDSVKGDLEDLRKQIASTQESIIGEVDEVKNEVPALIQQNLLYSQVAAIWAAVACIGAWVAVILTMRKKA
jgi:hypothetical protein